MERERAFIKPIECGRRKELANDEARQHRARGRTTESLNSNHFGKRPDSLSSLQQWRRFRVKTTACSHHMDVEQDGQRQACTYETATTTKADNGLKDSSQTGMKQQAQLKEAPRQRRANDGAGKQGRLYKRTQ
jgi:hypothetical protein